MTSASFEEARKLKSAEMAGGVRLVFPAFDALPEKTMLLGTRNFEADGEDYISALAEMPYLRAQRGLGQDGLDFTVNDAKSLWYEQIKPYEDVVVDTLVEAREFLRTKNEIFESEIILNGFLEQMTFSESNLNISFSAVSDMSRTGFLVGGRILTQRYCAAKFNKNGLKNPLFDACGWQAAQGGNPTFCTHKLKGTDGCEDHLNEHRYFAVEALTSAEITTTTGSGGWGYGGCFTPLTLVWMADGSEKPIYQVKKGDFVMSFTKTGEIVARKVIKTFSALADSHLVFDFGKERKLEVMPAHRFLIAHGKFQTAGTLDAGDAVKSLTRTEWSDLVIRNNFLNERRTRVRNFSVWGTNTYFVVVGNRKIGVHNRKDGNDILE